jgi:hypothetical protein
VNEIFLSYRRADDPGYVGRLADSLERVFGAGTVYRDVDSVRAGKDWKKAITRSVSGAQAVIAVIGPAWQELLTSWPAQESDWVRFELNLAKALDIPVIPVRLAHAAFDHTQDLEDLVWLTGRQFFELADGQGRWETDITRLVDELAKVTTLKVSSREQNKAGSITQVSHGEQAPNIVSGGGAVTMTYGKDTNEK